MYAEVGDKIRILYMKGEPQEIGKEGIITYIDDFNQYHGTWSSLAIIPDMDEFEIIN